MNKIKTYLDYLKQHQRNIEAAVIILVIAAVLVFGHNGEKSETKEPPPESQKETVEEIEEREDAEEDDTYQYSEETVRESPEPEMYVDISGCVKKPGIYKIERDTRLFQVIELAGGLTKNADYDGFNQAEHIQDGDKIIIPSKESGEENSASSGSAPSSSDGKININRADSTELQEIPGVGPSTAEKIISYREEHGRFRSKEELMEISGIGEKTYEKMKDKITI